MLLIKRTNSGHPHFQDLVKELDLDLKIRDGDDHLFYAELNKAAILKHTVVAYDGDQPVGSGALREYAPGLIEIKRMYVRPGHRGKGIASMILASLESWCRELGYTKCILETGRNQPEAIRLYEKNSYKPIPNYGNYAGAYNSVCFEKEL
ncbi:MAG TPA: GNAT family N-acetyltransferase [Chitinophagaceae bacterium]|jgi:GNAT superfamily N-acetyltransferase|nr:GNAT family N-acetyltransferase [Chitinophagaceae bacterium]